MIDRVDKEILKLLQQNGRLSLKTIAEKTFLSSPAVSARIERMENDGIILGYEAKVSPIRMGYHILAYINLNVQPEDKNKFYKYAESSVTCEYSVIMKAAFESTMKLDTFLGQLQKFGKTSTQIVFATHVGPRGIQIQE